MFRRCTVSDNGEQIPRGFPHTLQFNSKSLTLSSLPFPFFFTPQNDWWFVVGGKRNLFPPSDKKKPSQSLLIPVFIRTLGAHFINFLRFYPAAATGAFLVGTVFNFLLIPRKNMIHWSALSGASDPRLEPTGWGKPRVEKQHWNI